MTQPLSPAAQAIWNAYLDNTEWEVTQCELNAVAAALRAAANIMREAYQNEEYVDSPDDWLDDIAAELEHPACG